MFDELEITTFKTARLMSKDFMTGHHIPLQKFMASLKSKPEYIYLYMSPKQALNLDIDNLSNIYR